jgi:hypothetical protein
MMHLVCWHPIFWVNITYTHKKSCVHVFQFCGHSSSCAKGDKRCAHQINFFLLHASLSSTNAHRFEFCEVCQKLKRQCMHVGITKIIFGKSPRMIIASNMRECGAKIR